MQVPLAYQIQPVDLNYIDLKNTYFKISTHPPNPELIESIHHLGLINPPLLIINEQSKISYQIIYGFNRIQSCQALGWKHLNAHVLSSDLSDFHCAVLAICNNSFYRDLNLIELSRAFHLLQTHLPETIQLHQVATWLNLPNNLKMIEKIEKIYQMPQSLQQSMLSQKISLSMALQIMTCPERDRHFFISLFNLLKISLNKQREIFTLCYEIMARDDLTIQGFTQEKEWQDIMADTCDNNQKEKKIRTYLFNRRYPKLSMQQKRFQDACHQLEVNRDITIQAPPFFEGNVYTINMPFSSSESLKEKWLSLGQLIDNPDFKDLIANSHIKNPT